MSTKNAQHEEVGRMGEYLTETRREILRRLYERGPQALGALHRGWPMTRYHVRFVVRALAEEELVEVADIDGNAWSRRVRITALGIARFSNTADGGSRSRSVRGTDVEAGRASDGTVADGSLGRDLRRRQTSAA